MQQTPPPMNPGDEAPAGTPGTGEDMCPRCKGKGKLEINRTARIAPAAGKSSKA